MDLFDLAPFYVQPPAPLEPLTTGERRRQRHAEAAAGGFHPLYAALGLVLRLHPDAGPYAYPAAPGLRCGGCRFRRLVSGGARTYPKCLWPDPEVRPARGWPRLTHGPGTDIRASWPACVHHEPTPERGDP
ncbi:hypothetical protein GCM10009557_06140 [Virgisporangium ochraceum]|uniref:Uncharacterized protein n=1 Tax=Virgisporangium ochraceum TaxID=65505 RepID=A0A8J3ZQ77_9ACTN|nr:hypothetical protein [Virgisporangium ochraceum]GIJ66270.1 hypothetical protein Voc01_011870 [Virgisporangium ochraceum]